MSPGGHLASQAQGQGHKEVKVDVNWKRLALGILITNMNPVPCRD